MPENGDATQQLAFDVDDDIFAAVGRHGGYLAKQCDEFITKENSPNTYPVELKDEIGAFTASIMESGNQFESYIETQLAQRGVDQERFALIPEVRDENGERTVEGKRDKELATFAAIINPEIYVIFNARIGVVFEEAWAKKHGLDKTVLDPNRISEPDMLVRLEDGIWYPVDVKDHKTTTGDTLGKQFRSSTLECPWDVVEEGVQLSGQLRLGDWMQLAHYWRHMRSIGIVDEKAEPQGAVIGREEILVWFSLEKKNWLKYDDTLKMSRRKSALEIYDVSFKKALNIVAAARAADTDPERASITTPLWKSECTGCQWQSVCVEQMQMDYAGGHISLLPGVTPTKMRSHKAAGVASVVELAQLDVRAAREVELTGRLNSPGAHPVVAGYRGENNNGLVESIYQARASYHGKVARAPGVEKLELPRAAIEIDFDCEAFTGRDGNLVYMWGIRATGRSKKKDGSWRQRVETYTFDSYEHTEDAEKEVFLQTWAYFASMSKLARERKHSIRFYHYTGYERTQMVRIATKYADDERMPTVEEVTEFYDSHKVVDLYKICHKQLVWPTRSHSIKEIAKWVKFSWRDETPGGDQSLVWYDQVVNHPEKKVREEFKLRLRQYNEDDTRAQIAIRDWLTEVSEGRKPGEKLPLVTNLRPPAPRLR